MKGVTEERNYGTNATSSPIVEHLKLSTDIATDTSKLDITTDNAIHVRHDNSSAAAANDTNIVDAVTGSAKLKDVISEVAMSELRPLDLFLVPVKLGQTVSSALIDTGANVSLIREDVAKKLGCTIKSTQYNVMGVNETSVNCMGEITIDLHLHGLPMGKITLAIIASDEIKHPIVLGTDCFTQNKLLIDASRRRISGNFIGEAKWDLYVGNSECPCQILYSRIPVRATEKIKVSNDDLQKVPVTPEIDVSHYKCDYCDLCNGNLPNDFYYDGEVSPAISKYLVGYCGIVGAAITEVLVCQYESGICNKCTVKKGDLLGFIDSIVEIKDFVNTVEVNVAQSESEWTALRIKNEIKFSDEMTSKEMEQAYNMLLARRGVMSIGNSDVGFAAVTSHKIELYDTTPIRQRPRQFPEPVSKQIEAECQKLLDLDIIEHSKSPFAAPVVPVLKKSGELRLCIDYRLLNKVTKPDRFPVPNLRDQVYSLYDKSYFTTLDLTSGFHQIPLDETSREYTAFSTQKGHYQFRRLAFGLKNCPAAFQRELQFVLHEFKENVLIYIDDILITSKTFNEHIELVESVLLTLENHGMKIKVAKCKFFQDNVEFLGHHVSRTGLSKSKVYLDQISKFPKPETISQLRSFLGIINFQRKFLPNCSALAKPLSELTGGEGTKRLTWTDEMTDAFDGLKREILKEVQLSYPDYGPSANKLELHVDASGIGAGAALSQVQNGINKTIVYASMTFSKAQCNYSVIERELTALRWAVKHMKSFLYGIPFVIYTDHKPLVYLHNASHHNSRLSRTLDDLKDFEFELRYKPGRDNIVADYLSRICVPNSDASDTVLDDPTLLPDGLEVIRQVEGGGDSMVQSLYIVLQHHRKHCDPEIKVPITFHKLREDLVSKLIADPSRYGLQKSKLLKRSLLCIKKPGQLPITELLLVFSDLYKLTVVIHYGIATPVIFSAEDVDLTNRVHLQCLAGVHYNPVQETLIYASKSKLNLLEDQSVTTNSLYCSNTSLYNSFDESRTDNAVTQLSSKQETASKTSNNDVVIVASVMYSFTAEAEDELTINKGDIITITDCTNSDWWTGVNKHNRGLFPASHVFVHHCTALPSNNCNYSRCNHLGHSIASTSVYCTGSIGCALVDTGAQISLVSETMFNRICEKGAAGLDTDVSVKLSGVGRGNTAVLGTINLSIAINGMSEPLEHCFAVVKDSVMSYCFLLGMGFIDEVKLVLNFSNMTYCLTNASAGIPLGVLKISQSSSLGNIPTYANNLSINMCELVTAQSNSNLVSLDTIHSIQLRDFAIRQIKKKVVNKEPVRNFRMSCLKKFIPYHKHLRVYLDTLYYDEPNSAIPVVSFKFLVDTVEQFHVHNGHVGIHKLSNLVRKFLWHPAIQTVVHDVCVSCLHCQFAKLSHEALPPIRKIQAEGCFDMVVVDLIALPKSSSGHIGCFVAIDHYSKWLSVTPLRNKSGPSVASACEKMLVSLPRCPNRILSDNGPEFRCLEFNDLLQRYNIDHVFSTPNHPSSCGEVERVNRTVIALLKAESQTLTSWDVALPHATVVYNNTLHTELKMSPSEFILSNVHTAQNAALVPKAIKSNWTEGNPKFLPYLVGQKVLRKVPFKGRLTNDKLRLTYDGPYRINKVQPNEVSYIIEGIQGANQGVLYKAHHTQLKLFYDAPKYLREYRHIDPVVRNRVPETQLRSGPVLRNYDLSSDTDTDSDSESSDHSYDSLQSAGDSTDMESVTDTVSNRDICMDHQVENLSCSNPLTEVAQLPLEQSHLPNTPIDQNEHGSVDFSGFREDSALISKGIFNTDGKIKTSTPQTATKAADIDVSPIMVEHTNESVLKVVGELVNDSENMLTLIETTIAVQESILIHLTNEACSDTSELNKSFYDATDNLDELVVDESGNCIREKEKPVIDNESMVHTDGLAHSGDGEHSSKETINAFQGFTPTDESRNPLANLRAARRRFSLSPLKTMVAEARKEAEQFRRRNRERIVNLGRPRLQADLSSNCSNIDSPIRTRSRGPVPAISNVQERILEYKHS